MMRQRAPAHTKGFTLVELMVVILIISLLATIGIPALAKLKLKSKVTVVANDLRVLGAAFNSYSLETGTWPAEVAVGVVPAGMSERLPEIWSRRTPIGGRYNWENNQTHFGVRPRAAIAITPTAQAPLVLDVEQFLALESAIDPEEYNLVDGNFRVGTGLIPLYVVQP